MTASQPRSVVRRLGGVAVNLVLIACTVAAVAFLAPSLMGYERYVITGKSMTGTYDKGSVVFERPVPAEELEVGDVITYQPPADSGVQSLVTHRIIGVRTDEAGRRVFRTQGDANPHPDPWRFSLVDATQPVVEHHVPYVGFALIALADRQVRLVAISIPAGLIALGSLVQLVAALRQGRREVPNCGSAVAVESNAGGAPEPSVDHEPDREPDHTVDAPAPARTHPRRPIVLSGRHAH